MSVRTLQFSKYDREGDFYYMTVLPLTFFVVVVVTANLTGITALFVLFWLLLHHKAVQNQVVKVPWIIYLLLILKFRQGLLETCT